MASFIILRLDAPLMSFGDAIVDNLGKTRRFMSLSALTGLLANALGFDHADADKTQRLQERLRFAQRCDRPGQALQDFQTVALGQDFMTNENAWTSWGRVDERKGGAEAQKGTHIRFRDFIADAVYTLAFTLTPADELPALDAVESALRHPARPLFIGRKPCLPSTPLLLSRQDAGTPLDALRSVPRISADRTDGTSESDLPAWWSTDDGGQHDGPFREFELCDQRDWRNQVHSGQRRLRHGLIEPASQEEAQT